MHTSDWHVGKAIRGNSRASEHRRVFTEMVAIAAENEVDLILVAGDLFETSAPSAESEQIVYETLLSFSKLGVPVAVISGNHDNPRKLRAVAPLLALGNVSLVTEPSRPDDGGVQTFRTAGGTTVNVAMLPFVSQRGVVRAEHLMEQAAFEHAQMYSGRMQLLIEALTGGFTADAVNIVMSHCFVQGGAAGGGERSAHLAEEYQVSSQSFPATANYVALGHLHRPQKVPAGPSVHYCGSPLQLDFGESNQTKQVNVVELQPGLPARVSSVELTSGCPLLTLSGTMDQLRDVVGTYPDNAWLRIVVREQARAGLAESVRELFGARAVDVRLEQPAAAARVRSRGTEGKAPRELFADFLATQSIDDDRIINLFSELLEEVEEGSAT